MRKIGTLKIDNREITVKELRVKDLLALLNGVDDQETNVQSLMERIEAFLPKAADIQLSELYEMAPSEIRQIYEKFKEVNAVFFETARALGLGDFLKKLKASLLQDFSVMLPGLSKPDTKAP